MWFSLTVEVASLADKYNGIASRLQSTLSYADINIAGFRKILKQYEKQIPPHVQVTTITQGEYKEIVIGLIELVSEMESVRAQTEAVMHALTPHCPDLKIVKLGSETLTAISASYETRSTTTPEKDEVDLMKMLSGVDTEKLRQTLNSI